MNLPVQRLAEDGPTFSRLVYGAWRLADDPASATPARVLAKLKTCLEVGITTFDHADIYGDYQCEELFGRALADLGRERDQLQLVTKCGIKLISSRRPDHHIKSYDTSRGHIFHSVESSLKALRTDRIDLLLIHRPDPLMDPSEVADAFSQLRRAGKVLHFGVSNFTPSQLDLLASYVPFPLVTNQIELNVLKLTALHDGTVDQCLRLGICPMAWSPLGGGQLFKASAARERAVGEAMRRVGEELGGATVDQVALAFLLRHPASILPVIGTGDLDRIRAAAAAVRLRLTREMWFEIWSASAGGPVP